MKKECPFCHKTIYYDYWRKFVSHCGNCSYGPNYKTKIEKQRNALIGKKASIETRKKMSLSRIGNKNPFYGKKHTIKTKRKLRADHLGTKHSLETIEKIRSGNIGVKRSNETRARMCLARAKRIFPFKDTKIEKIVQKELRKNNINFRKHEPIIGQPDIFIEPNVCIFCDGNYWHADPKKYKPNYIFFKSVPAKDIWNKDKIITKTLIKRGYKVLRFWETDINSNIDNVMRKIKRNLVI